MNERDCIPETRAFSPFVLGDVELRNRVVMAPMSQYSSVDGFANQWHLVHYGSRAVGGCGFLLIEDTAITADGRTSQHALGLYNDAHIAPLAEVVDFSHRQGAVVGIQLSHAGRKALRETRGSGVDLVGAGSVAFGEEWQAPRGLTAGDIELCVADFMAAARRAIAAGVDAIEIHSAHGYLLHQFLSPVTNQRGDNYGGDTAGRARLLLEIVDAVRAIWPAPRPLFVRLPAEDGVPGGLDSDDVLAVAQMLKDRVTLIDVAGSSLLPQKPPVPHQIMHARSRTIRERTGLLTCVGGGVATGADANRLILDGTCDLVSVGRPMLASPYWVLDAARDVGAALQPPRQYLAA